MSDAQHFRDSGTDVEGTDGCYETRQAQDGGYERQDGGHDGYEPRQEGGHDAHDGGGLQDDGGHDCGHDGGHTGHPHHEQHQPLHQDGGLAHHEQEHQDEADVGHDGAHDTSHDGGHEGIPLGSDGVHDVTGHVVEGAHDHGDYISLTVKIGDAELNGCSRYRAWTDHRDAVMQRLGGWDLVATGQDFATFTIPQGVAQAAAIERMAKLSKFDRKYWGDKTDFCRCLETTLWELEKGRKPPRARRQQIATPGDSAHAQGVGFQRDERPRASVHAMSPCMQGHASMAYSSRADSVDMLLRLIESKDPRELVGYERRLRTICNRLELELHGARDGLGVKSSHVPKDCSALIELPLPPSAPQTIKRGCGKIQRSMLPVRLSMQMEEMHQKMAQLILSVQQGFLDPKALGVKAHHESNPAHVGALLKTGLAVMGKESVDDAMEHWMCVPRPRLVEIYIDEFSRIIKSIADQAQEHAHMSPPGPLAKYAHIESSSYADKPSKERLGERILHSLNVMVVPIIDKTSTPPQVTKGIMSNPLGMPDDYLIRYLDMLYKNVGYVERQQGAASLLGQPQDYEILRATLPKDAVPLVEALICAYGGEEERMRLGIPMRRKTAAFERVLKARQDLDMLAKSADAHIATSTSKSPHSAREYHIRAKAKQLGIWLDPSKRTTALDRRRPPNDGRSSLNDPSPEALCAYRPDSWEQEHEDLGLGALAFAAQAPLDGEGQVGARSINSLPMHRLAALGESSGRLGAEEVDAPRLGVEEVEARIQADLRAPLQVQVKIGDHEQNGNFRYKAWALHRDLVLSRLRWDLVEQHGQYITFNVCPLPPPPSELLMVDATKCDVAP